MKNILYLLSFLLLCTATTCKKIPTYELGEAFTLQPEQFLACNCKDKTLVQFVKIKEDSRCPKNVNCMWAGQVTVSLMVNEQAMDLTLGSRKKGESSKTMDGYTVALKSVSPYPENDNKIKPEDYRVELVVTGKP